MNGEHAHTGQGPRLAFRRAVFPELAEFVDRVIDNRPDSANADLEHDWIDREADRVRETVLAGAAFSQIADAEVRDRFHLAFERAREVAAWGGIPVPTPEEFAANGVELDHLARRAAADAELQLVPAPRGIGVRGWREIFSRACEVSGSPLRDGGLQLSTEIERAFTDLDGEMRAAHTVPGADRRGTGRSRAHPWSLRLVPAAPAPPLMGLAFPHGPHVTLPEMLMLQAMRIAAGDEPVDRHSFTWIAGRLADGKLAARHVFDGAQGVISISVRETGQQGPHQGARPPIG